MRRHMVAAIGFVVMCLPAGAQTLDWVMIELRHLPAQCAEPLACVDQSELLLRNLMSMAREDRLNFSQRLDQVAAMRAVPDSAVANLNLSLPALTQHLHEQPDPASFAALVDHPGVYFDSATLDANPDTEGFAAFIRTQMEAVGLQFLSEAEREQTPGRPIMTVRYSAHRESEGCIHPFFVSISIKEDVVLTRNPGIRITTNTWSASARQDLASLNYSPESALRDVVARFISDWNAAHQNN